MDSASQESSTSRIYNGPMPVKMCNMDLGLQNGVLRNGKSSSAKKTFKFAVPVRMCDMDPCLFVPDSAKKKKVRKQLWSTEKDHKRFTTTMKLDTKFVRKTICKKTADDSLLTDLENFDQNPNKFKTKSLIQTLNKKNHKEKLNLNSKRPSLKINNPPRLLTPKIKISGSGNKRASENFNKRYSPHKNKNESMDNILINVLNKQCTEISNKVELKFSEITSLIILEQKKNEITNNKLDDILHKLNLKFDEISKRLDNLELSNNCKHCSSNILEMTNSFSAEKTADCLNSSCFIVENQTDKKSETKSSTDKSSISLTTPDVNQLINNVLSNMNNSNPQQINAQSKVDKASKIVDPSNKIKPEINILEENKNKLIAERKKLMNKFELLESNLEFYSPMSDEFSISDTDSPTFNKDINCLINDKDDFKLNKSLSTASILDIKSKKSVNFLPKTFHKDPVESYNEIKNNCKILYTPKNTRTVSNLMTPSIEMSGKKIISLRVQKQLLMLD